MDFFKSVLSEDASPPSSPPSGKNSETIPATSSNSQNNPSISTAWTFGSTLFKTITAKSESVIGNYRRDLEDFSSGLRKETATIREVASRAVKDFPARLESGAAVAQTSLESVGQAIDNLGSTVTDIITHGKDSIFNADDDDSDAELIGSSNDDNNSSNDNKQNVKPYSRIDAVIREVQCNIKTYNEEPDDLGEYTEWKEGFVLEEKSEEIEDLVKENRVIEELYAELVPGQVDHGTFWSRYFYKVYRVKKAEAARAKLVKRVIEGEEEEELSWDVDDDEDEDSGFQSKDELRKEVEENKKKVENLKLGDGEKSPERGDDEKESVSEVKSDGGVDEKLVLDDKVSSEGKNDNVSDFSVISSQPSSHEEVDLGWDEVEDIGSGDESKTDLRVSPNRADLRKRLSAAEEDEDLTWDIEDDEETLKS